MRVYIAARYKWEIGEKIFLELKKSGIDAFLPKSLNIDATTDLERDRVFKQCMHQIVNECDVILFVYPFKYSVSAEIGMAAVAKHYISEKIILLLNLSDETPCIPQLEGMTGPAIDKVFVDFKDVLDYLKTFL